MQPVSFAKGKMPTRYDVGSERRSEGNTDMESPDSAHSDKQMGCSPTYPRSKASQGGGQCWSSWTRKTPGHGIAYGHHLSSTLGGRPVSQPLSTTRPSQSTPNDTSGALHLEPSSRSSSARDPDLRHAQTRQVKTWLLHPEAYELHNGKRENERDSNMQPVFTQLRKVALSEDEKGSSTITAQQAAYRRIAACTDKNSERSLELAGIGTWVDDSTRTTD